MREILFRGKRVDNGEWVYGNLIINQSHHSYIALNDCIYLLGYGDVSTCVESRFHNVIQETIGQYTGLKDKNGKEIYEGDICMSNVHTEIPIYHKIEWSDKYLGWFAKNIGNSDMEYANVVIQLFMYAKEKLEVIGNIHENPELLKVVE